MAAGSGVKVPKPFKGVDAEFTRACEAAGVSPTNRQYRRFLQGRGQAFAKSRAMKQLVGEIG